MKFLSRWFGKKETPVAEDPQQVKARNNWREHYYEEPYNQSLLLILFQINDATGEDFVTNPFARRTLFQAYEAGILGTDEASVIETLLAEVKNTVDLSKYGPLAEHSVRDWLYQAYDLGCEVDV